MKASLTTPNILPAGMDEKAYSRFKFHITVFGCLFQEAIS
jgi:hypothetical protein